MGLVDLSYGPFGHPSHGPCGHHPSDHVTSGGRHSTENYSSLNWASQLDSANRSLSAV
jgi:hypothetical protein